ncbi:hypothetical protein HYV79_04280 [Candidatus Woesearchaeota archaeon]|nr:hypothetical protein [Candidatus Woesearchaeota archaeon]
MKNLVLNTSSSIFFAKIGLLPHLLKHLKLITSKEIYQEVLDGDELRYKDAKIIMQYFENKKIKIIKAKQTKKIAKEFKISENDASVISLAHEQNCFLASEDRQIERICLITQTHITNSALLLYLLWKKNEFNADQSFLLLDLLMKNGYNKEICLKIKEKIMKGD